MWRRITFYIVIILTSVFVGVSISSSAEIKTLEDFRNSAFIKKYPQKRQMRSWSLRDGGYNYSFSFPLGNPPLYDEYDWFSVEVVVKSKDSPIIYHLGIMFHDESAPSGPTSFTKHIREISQDFIRSIDSTLPLKDVVEYVQSKSVFKYPGGILDAPKETFAKYSFRVGIVGHDLIISIDTTTGC